MGEEMDIIEIFNDEDETVIEPIVNKDLYDINGNLITADDAKNTLPDNTDLIQKAIDGDKKAFNELYMQSYRYVFFVVKNYIPDDETAYDVIQESFIKVYKNISKLRSPAAYYGWITIIAKNTACDFVRAARFESPLSYEQEDYRDFLNDDATEKDVSLDIEMVLKKLSSEEAELLSLVYYDGMSISQIAKMQGVPATTVYSRFNKAKKNLKVQLNAHGIDKAIYSGNFIAMITTAMRNIIGTALLSVAIAQQILDSIINGKGKKEIAIAKIIKSQQKKSILKIASVIVAISMVTSAVTALTLTDWNQFKISEDKNNSTETVTEYHYYHEAEKDDNSSQNSGGFWGNLFGGGSSDSKTSSDTNTSSNASYSSSQQSKPSASSSSSKNNSSVNPTINGSVPSYSTPDNYNPTNDTDKPPEVINVFGNNPNNVMRPYEGDNYGMVTRQGDWIYYVQAGVRIMRMKADGSQKEIICEASSYVQIRGLNVIGDTIYYISGGIWSIKTDGTGKKQISSLSASNLLVRGTTGWFAVLDDGVTLSTPPGNVNYDLYQIDLLTGETDLLVQNASGLGLKTVIDDDLIYVDGNTVYKRNLSTGSKSVLVNFDSDGYISGVENMLVYKSSLYFDFYSSRGSDYYTAKFELDSNNKEVYVNKFRYILNLFDYNGPVFFARECVSPFAYSFFDANATALCPENENLEYSYNVYGLDDGYVYYYDTKALALYRCRPDGTDIKTY